MYEQLTKTVHRAHNSAYFTDNYSDSDLKRTENDPPKKNTLTAKSVLNYLWERIRSHIRLRAFFSPTPLLRKSHLMLNDFLLNHERLLLHNAINHRHPRYLPVHMLHRLCPLHSEQDHTLLQLVKLHSLLFQQLPQQILLLF